MSTSQAYIEYILDQIEGAYDIRCRKMFGEYLIYINNKPILLVCDNTVYVKQDDAIKDKMINAKCKSPYKGAKEHYILDIENTDFTKEIIKLLEQVTPLPKKKKNK